MNRTAWALLIISGFYLVLTSYLYLTIGAEVIVPCQVGYVAALLLYYFISSFTGRNNVRRKSEG